MGKHLYKMPLPMRFWPKVNKEGTIHPIHGQCWEWMACRNVLGYGTLAYDGTSRLAHRIAWFLETGQWPTKALHKCDNPPCVRFSHLFEGTNQDNTDDMLRKGRAKKSKGEAHWAAKLTDAQVIHIRESSDSSRSLAIKYNVTPETIYYIRDGKTWKHLL